MIWLLFLLFTKHFLADFIFQPPYMWKNKGTFLHPGGLLHAGLHAAFTFLILILFVSAYLAPVCFVVSWIEFFTHYIIDFFKMNINRVNGWECNKHEKFWWLLGLDQYLHYLCYLAIAWYVYGQI